MNSQLVKTDNNKSIFGKKIKESINKIPEVSDQIASEVLQNLGLKIDKKIAFKGKQDRFNKAYNKNNFKKAFNIVKPADRDRGLTINIKGDYSYDRLRGTLTENFYNLFEKTILPKIKSSEFDLSITIHCSNDDLPSNSLFDNNLDMTVKVANNLESYIGSLKLKKNVYVYGMGDMLPKGLDSLMRVKPEWEIGNLNLELIKELNLTKKQKNSNNRVTIEFLNPV